MLEIQATTWKHLEKFVWWAIRRLAIEIHRKPLAFESLELPKNNSKFELETS